MPRVRHLTLASLALLTALVGGCQTSPKYRVPVDGPAATAGLPLALDIENRSGPVVVQLDTSLSAPQVSARPLKVGGASWAAASYVEEGGRGVLRVLHTPNDSDPSMVGPSLLLIRTPMADAVRIRTADGSVELNGIAPNSIEIESGAFGGAGGAVTVNTRGDITGPVTITAVSGDVLYRVGEGSTGKLEASAGGGQATIQSHSATFGSSSASVSKFSGVLNKGENPVKLSTEKGSVRVEVVPANDKPSGK